MKRVFFDTNVFAHIDENARIRSLILNACRQGLIEIIVTPVVREELERGPLGGVPDWLPHRHEGEGILVAGGRVGDHVSDGRLAIAHLGKSKHINDAILAESAVLADVCVSEDRRFLRRLRRLGAECTSMKLIEFEDWLSGLPTAAAP